MVGVLVDILRELVLSLYFVDHKATFHTDKIHRLDHECSRVLGPLLCELCDVRHLNKETMKIVPTEAIRNLYTHAIPVQWAH